MRQLWHHKVIIAVCILFIALLSFGAWVEYHRVGLTDKVCDNQQFSLTALDDALTAAARLVDSNKPANYDPVLKQEFFETYQEIHHNIIARKADLRRGYCE